MELHENEDYVGVLDEFSLLKTQCNEIPPKAIELKALAHFQLDQYVDALACWNQIPELVNDPKTTLIWEKIDCLIELKQYRAADKIYISCFQNPLTPISLKAKHRVRLANLLSFQNIQLSRQVSLLRHAIPDLIDADKISQSLIRLKELTDFLDSKKDFSVKRHPHKSGIKKPFRTSDDDSDAQKHDNESVLKKKKKRPTPTDDDDDEPLPKKPKKYIPLSERYGTIMDSQTELQSDVDRILKLLTAQSSVSTE